MNSKKNDNFNNSKNKHNADFYVIFMLFFRHKINYHKNLNQCAEKINK